MIVFENDDNGSVAWMRANRDGFVLARRSKRDGVLHSVQCSHLDDDGSYARTKKAKVCASDSSELRRWASENGIDVSSCGDC